MNGLVPCSPKYTGIFYTCISVKMCQCSEIFCFPGYNHAIKYQENLWNAGQCFLNLLTVEEGQG